MTWWLPHDFSKKHPALRVRGICVRAVRQWFEKLGFDEVQTPALQVCPVMDAHIHGFKADLKGPDLNPLRNLYLHTSPEFAMKKLLTAGMEKIYQLCPVYRNADISRLHSPEFTLLEWYRTQTHYTAMMEDCTALIRTLSEATGTQVMRFGGVRCDPQAAPVRLSVRHAFDQMAGIDLDSVLDDREGFMARVRETGIRVAQDDGWDDLFFRVMADKVEPHLGVGAPTILYDYPVCMASLARRRPDDRRYAERFELYICGVELVNAFSELTDPAEQRVRFETEMALKERLYGERYPIDEDFLRALEHGMPESSGAALGFDRLVMLLAGEDTINAVQWAPVL